MPIKKPYKPIILKSGEIHAVLMDGLYENDASSFITAMSAWINWKQTHDAKNKENKS